MLRLKKAQEFIFEPGSLTALENESGQIFVGANTLTPPRVPCDFALYRWDGNAGWELLCRHDGQAASSRHTMRRSFDDPPRRQLVFLIEEISGSFLTAIDYDGQTVSKTPCKVEKRSISYISRFPNGDYLLYGENDTPHCHFAERLATDGVILWAHRWTDGEIGRALALPDNTAALLICGPGISACHLELLDAEGHHLRTVGESLYCDPLCLPEIHPSNGDWVIEDTSTERADTFAILVHRFRRLHFDSNWNLLCIQEAAANAYTSLLEHTFYPDGILLGSLSPLPPCRICWTPLNGAPARTVFSSEGLAGHLALAVHDIPLFCREDNSFLFALSNNNDNARFSVLGVSPEGETLWAKKFRCEGQRHLFLRGNQMFVILSSFEKSSAVVYELPGP